MNYYTYLWLREDGTPYYVGKGTGTRAWRKGAPHRDRVLVQEFPSEEDAFLSERFLIALYGRKDLGTGILMNCTDGGDGSSGAKRSEEFKKKLRAANMGKTLTPEHRKKLSIAKRPHSEEWRKNQRLVMTGRIASKETKAKMSLWQVGKKLSQETKDKIRAKAIARSLRAN
jgi:hypothetical protein